MNARWERPRAAQALRHRNREDLRVGLSARCPAPRHVGPAGAQGRPWCQRGFPPQSQRKHLFGLAGLQVSPLLRGLRLQRELFSSFLILNVKLSHYSDTLKWFSYFRCCSWNNISSCSIECPAADSKPGVQWGPLSTCHENKNKRRENKLAEKISFLLSVLDLLTQPMFITVLRRCIHFYKVL